MNYKNIIKVSLAALASLAILAGCAKKEEFKEITEMTLARCLQPQDLSARVDATTGDYVTFGWAVNKDAQQYLLTVYMYDDVDEEWKEDDSYELDPGAVPFTVRLTADNKYWFTVSAYRVDADGFMVEGSESILAVFDGEVKTYAVKDNLFPEVTARTATSFTLSWSKDLEDYVEVTTLRAAPVKGGSTVTHEITSAEAEAGTATIEGLAASTEYQVTLMYMSASRGAVDTWTLAAQGEAVKVSTSDELKTAAAAGGNYYLASGSYTMGSAKPTASLTLVGELDADGNLPVVEGYIDLSANLANNSSLYFENIHFSDAGTNGHLVNFSNTGTSTLAKVEFVNCEVTGFKSGLFYNNKGTLTLGELLFDSCSIHNILGSGGDGIDIRKPTTITTIKFVNNTIYDGIRTFFRLDQVEGVTIGEVDFENNTVKNVATILDGTNSRGVFSFFVATNLVLKNNLFLWEDGGKTGEGEVDHTQLIQDNAKTVVPTITASGNWTYAQGKDFFRKVDATTAGFKILTVDPCYNSKGNFFQLAAQDLIEDKVGASKWWIPYAEKPEDLTQHVLDGAHTWNLQNASLFAGNVKNARVRDELMLVGTEATPMNADGAINFLSASALSKKGLPTEGYLSFKVNTPGSVDMLVAEGGASSVVVAIYDDNGYAVQGGVMTPNKGEVQKVVVPKVTGEATVYLYATGAISLVKLAWSEDVLAGNSVLATPKPVVEPVTLTEGDETAVTVTWKAVDNAASYVVVFNKRAQPAQTELTFTVAAEDVAALKAGLYDFTVQAFPREDDIYYTKSDLGKASVAIQPKGGDEQVEVTLSWDFSDADWQAEFAKLGEATKDIASADFTLNDLHLFWSNKCKYNTTYLQWGGKSSGTDRYVSFTAPEQGTLKVWATNTGDTEDLTRMVTVDVNGDVQSLAGGYAAKDGPHELEFSIAAGEVKIYPTGNGLRFYKVEFTYMSGAKKTIEHDWDFSASDWQAEFAKLGEATKDIASADFTYDDLHFFWSSKCKYNTTYLQWGGKSSGTDRYVSFTAPEQGTLKVWATNTGDTEDLTRMVTVDVNGDVQSLAGGYAAKDGPHELEFSIAAGEVKIYPTGNGLRFYHIYYINQ